MSDASFRGDCARCDALCCKAIAFDRGPLFAFDKRAGDTCPKLGADHRCTIHERLELSGFAGCAAFDCLGAGQLATAMFARLDLDMPAVGRARFDAFERLRRLQGLRFALARYGVVIRAPRSYAELLTLNLGELRRRLVARVRSIR